MADESTYLLIVATAVAILVFYAYITSIWKVLERVGFSVSEVSVIVLLTLFLGSLTMAGG
jgi:hypothetical protein